MEQPLEEVYARLYAHFGPQHWWPSETPFETIVGAILTQNTAWTNVEKALANLKRAGRLDPARLRATRADRLASLIRPSGYYNLKAKRLHAFLDFLFQHHRGRLGRLFRLDVKPLREQLLAVYGIGPETADSIILYAAGKPVFVVDAYTRRIMARVGLAREEASYDELQQMFMAGLPHDVRRFNEYHALLVALGKDWCTKRAPRCEQCPLRPVCRTGKSSPRQAAQPRG